MKNNVVIGIAMLLLVIVAFSGCIDEETPKSTESSFLSSKAALQPGVYDVTEMSHLPMTISLGNDTYLVLTDADKERISGYFENKGRYLSAFDLEVIFRDKNGKVVNKGVQEIRVQKEEELFLKRKVPVYVEIPLDFFETWEVRGSSLIADPCMNILDIGRSQEVKLSAYEEKIVIVANLTGTIDVKRSGKDNVTATLIGEIESKSDKKLIILLSFRHSNFSYYDSIGLNLPPKSTVAYLYLEPLEMRTFEAPFSIPAYETDELFIFGVDACDADKLLISAEYQDRII